MLFRGSDLLHSVHADVRAVLMTSSHSEGPSESSRKVVFLPEEHLWINPIPCNPQAPDWTDTFNVVVEGTTLTITRTDIPAGLETGWAQDLELEATRDLTMLDRERASSRARRTSPAATAPNPEGERGGAAGGGNNEAPGARAVSWKESAGRTWGRDGYVLWDGTKTMKRQAGNWVKAIFKAKKTANPRGRLRLRRRPRDAGAGAAGAASTGGGGGDGINDVPLLSGPLGRVTSDDFVLVELDDFGSGAGEAAGGIATGATSFSDGGHGAGAGGFTVTASRSRSSLGPGSFADVLGGAGAGAGAGAGGARDSPEVNNNDRYHLPSGFLN